MLVEESIHHTNCDDGRGDDGRGDDGRGDDGRGDGELMELTSTHVAHNSDAKTVELSANWIGQGRWGFIQGKITALSKCLVAKMANNQLPPSSFSKSECLQWWALTSVKKTAFASLWT